MSKNGFVYIMTITNKTTLYIGVRVKAKKNCKTDTY